MGDENDKSKDTDVTNDDGHGENSGSLLNGDFGSGSSYGDTGGLTDSTPFLSNYDGLSKAFQNLSGGEEIAGSITDVGIQIVDFGANMGLLLVDPIGFLINAGIGLLIDFVQPLEDLLGMVTGNPERMGAESDKWGRVRSALEPMAEQVKQTGSQKLTGWSGDASTVAKQRLNEFGDAINAVGHQITTIESVLELAKALASVAQDLIKGMIGDFITERVIAWMVATATATVSAGASIAAFVAHTLMAYSKTVLKITSAMRRGAKIFQAILEILKKFRQVVRSLGDGFALIKAAPGVLGKGESEGRSGPGMSNPQISNAMQ